jgi:predicted DNA-binding transcriptional regulator YafY
MGGAMKYRTCVDIIKLLEANPAGLTVAELIGRLRLQEEGLTYESAKRYLNRTLNAMSTEFPIRLSGKPKAGVSQRWVLAQSVSRLKKEQLNGGDARFVKDFAKCFLPHQVYEQLGTALEANVERLLLLIQSGRVRERLHFLPAQSPLQAPEVNPNVVESILRGVLEKRALSVRYKSRSQKKEITCREFSPLGLIVQQPVIYVVGKMAWANDVRHYALHRFIKANLATNTPFEEPPNFSLGKWVNECASFSASKKSRLVFRMAPGTAEHLKETPLAKGQTMLLQKDGWYRVSVNVHLREEILWWLAGFGDLVEVEAPHHIRANVKKMLINALELYAPTV